MEETHRIVRDGVARAVAGVGLTGVALIHLLDVQSKFEETPYIAWMYIGLIAACLATAFALVRTSHHLAWAATLALPASAAVSFILNRTVGLPQATGDIGNWLEPLGLASLLIEGCLVGLAADMLLLRAEERRAPGTVRMDSAAAVRS